MTVLAYGTMVYVAAAAAAETGIDAEMIDLRTLLPYDLETIAASVEKAGRASSPRACRPNRYRPADVARAGA